MDCSPPGSSFLRILQTRILEWIVNSLSRGSSWPRGWTWASCVAVRFFTIWDIGKSNKQSLSIFNRHWEDELLKSELSVRICSFVLELRELLFWYYLQYSSSETDIFCLPVLSVFIIGFWKQEDCVHLLILFWSGEAGWLGTWQSQQRNICSNRWHVIYPHRL